ncbi:alkaline ceramidase 3-like [Crotalus adamanteus]|uniref:Alkaline ceramidase n=1 Tax=Crotalus adamanteus TaxID=8729 RepID=A0AAW1BKC3_CROAD
MPPLVSVVTQFHAWWHIFTGLGSYLHILFSLYSRTLYLKYRPKVKFLFGIWPVLLVESTKKPTEESQGIERNAPLQNPRREVLLVFATLKLRHNIWVSESRCAWSGEALPGHKQHPRAQQAGC